MSEWTMWECEGCGDRHGHRTEMTPYPLVRAAKSPFEAPTEETVHACLACVPEGASAFDPFASFGVRKGEVAAVQMADSDEWVPVDDVDDDAIDRVVEWLEENALYGVGGRDE